MLIWIILLYVTNIFDVVFTWYIIETLGGEELNPFVEWMLNISNYWVLLIYKLIVITILILSINYLRKWWNIIKMLTIAFIGLNIYQVGIIYV